MTGRMTGPSRRGFLAGAGGLVAAAGLAAPAGAQPAPAPIEPFHGPHQAGIATAQQAHTLVAAFDVTAKTAADLAGLLRIWTAAAAALTRGQAPDGDGGDALGLGPARLTITVGFGPSLFVKDGQDRFGLAARRPAALVDLPRFNGDQMIPGRTDGDLSVQACAEDPQVALHAIRELARLAYGAADLRWTQAGFLSRPADGSTPRNLMGFKDGTRNPSSLDTAVWVGDEGPAWMRGGSYVVFRRIRIALEHWARMPVDDQEEVIGRHKLSGAPIGLHQELDPPDFEAADAEGNPVIAETAHLRMAAPETNGGASMLRRGYSYNDGSNRTAERWPPWRQAIEFDAGLLFVAYQRDPRTGFIKVFEPMARMDALNQFTTHTGGGLFACPGGVVEGAFIGQRLFEA